MALPRKRGTEMNYRTKLLGSLLVVGTGYFLFGPDAGADYARCKLKHDDYMEGSTCMRANGWHKNRSGKGWHWLVDVTLPKAAKREPQPGEPGYQPDFAPKK